LKSVIFGPLFFLLLTCLPSPLQAAETKGEGTWWTRDETILTATLLTAGGMAFLADEEIRKGVQRSQSGSLNSFADGAGMLGSPPVTVATGAMWYAWGRLAADEYQAETGMLATQAVIVAGAATLALKYGAGRDRPNEEDGAQSFRPVDFEKGYDDALPSAHTSGAFALAAVMSRRSESAWAPHLWYGMATIVGVSRIYQDEHWTSDVLLGALIGELAGRWALRPKNPAAPSVTLRPLTQGACAEIVFRW
jgi:membrane-associated phospholipid phosphatase